MNETTTVFLSPEDASLFLQFQKRYALIKLLESLKVFDITQGSVTIHFNQAGQINAVEVNKKYVPL